MFCGPLGYCYIPHHFYFLGSFGLKKNIKLFFLILFFAKKALKVAKSLKTKNVFLCRVFHDSMTK